MSYTAYDIAPVKEGGQASLAGIRIQYNIRTGLPVASMTSPGAGPCGASVTQAWRPMAMSSPGPLSMEASSTRASKGWGAILILGAQKDAISGTVFAPRLGVAKRL